MSDKPQTTLEKMAQFKTSSDLGDFMKEKWGSANAVFYFAQLLRGEATLDATREDILSFVGAKDETI